jgi:hypothetical protein
LASWFGRATSISFALAGYNASVHSGLQFFRRPKLEVKLAPSFLTQPDTAEVIHDVDIELLQVTARRNDISRLKAQAWINKAGPTELLFSVSRYQRGRYYSESVGPFMTVGQERPRKPVIALAQDEQRSLILTLRASDVNKQDPVHFVDIKIKFLSLGNKLRGKTLYKLRLTLVPDPPHPQTLDLKETHESAEEIA